MSRNIITTVAAAALAVAAGCASRDGANDYGSEDVRSIQTVSYGTVESVRTVQINESEAPVGTIAGAALGGLLGSQVGHGGGSIAAAIVGAVGGGIAGNAIEKNAMQHNGEEIVVRLEDGSTIAVVQGGDSHIRTGDRVRVLKGARGARIERI